MSNPFFSSSPVFGKGKTTRGTGPASTLDATSMAQPGMDSAALDQRYRAPSATSWDTDRMTYDDVIVRTGSLLAIVVGVGAVTWVVDRTSVRLLVSFLCILLSGGFVSEIDVISAGVDHLW